MSLTTVKVVFLFFAVSGLFGGSLLGRETVPEGLKDVRVDERLGEVLPREVRFRDADGNDVSLGKFFDTGKPTILSFVYLNCPLLCNLVLSGLSEGLESMPLGGDRYQIITVSFDSQDTVDIAKQYENRYRQQLTSANREAEWFFLTGDQDAIQKVTEAAGFKFNKLPNGEFSHDAALIFLTPDGTISRYLYGIQFSSFDIKMAILEALKGNIVGKTISTVERALLFCYNYDPTSGGYALQAVRIMRIGSAVIAAVIGIILANLFYREHRRRHYVKDKE